LTHPFMECGGSTPPFQNSRSTQSHQAEGHPLTQLRHL
jgi:hypothetical protein